MWKSDACTLSVSCASVLAPTVTGSIFVTIPTRKPPSRTSLPSIRFEPSPMSTFSSRVGTNGRPRLEL